MRPLFVSKGRYPTYLCPDGSGGVEGGRRFSPVVDRSCSSWGGMLYDGFGEAVAGGLLFLILLTLYFDNYSVLRARPCSMRVAKRERLAGGGVRLVRGGVRNGGAVHFTVVDSARQ